MKIGTEGVKMLYVRAEDHFEEDQNATDQSYFRGARIAYDSLWWSGCPARSDWPVVKRSSRK